MNDKSSTRSAWLEPMCYLVWCLPLLPMLAVACLFYLATASSNEIDPVRRMAQIQTLADESDQHAAEMALQGRLRLSAAQIELTLNSKDAALHLSQPIALLFVHPTNASKDRGFTLTPNGSGAWQSTFTGLAASASHWRIRVFPLAPSCTEPLRCLSAAHWQLHAQLKSTPSEREIALLPRYAMP